MRLGVVKKVKQVVVLNLCPRCGTPLPLNRHVCNACITAAVNEVVAARQKPPSAFEKERAAHPVPVAFTIKTRVPSKWVLFDTETGERWTLVERAGKVMAKRFRASKT